MPTASFALADTNVHNVKDLFTTPGVLEATNNFPNMEYREVHFIPDPGNGGTIAISSNPDVDIAGKEYAYLLSSTSPALIIRPPADSQRVFLSDFWVAASVATQTLHILALP